MDRRNVIKQLENMLLEEYLQRDVYETYSYYLFGLCSPELQKHLIGHRQEEDAHIALLQRYLMAFRAGPLLKRKPIPKIDPPIGNVLLHDLELEKLAVENYAKAIHGMHSSPDPQLVALRVDLENILVQEQEHVHDLLRWLRTSHTDDENSHSSKVC